MTLIQEAGFNLLVLADEDRAGAYRGRVQRHATVKVKGKRGVWRVLKRGGRGKDWNAFYAIQVEQVEGGRLRCRTSAKTWKEHDELHHDHHQPGAKRFQVQDITHLAVHARPRRRRRRW